MASRSSFVDMAVHLSQESGRHSLTGRSWLCVACGRLHGFQKGNAVRADRRVAAAGADCAACAGRSHTHCMARHRNRARRRRGATAMHRSDRRRRASVGVAASWRNVLRRALRADDGWRHRLTSRRSCRRRRRILPQSFQVVGPGAVHLRQRLGSLPQLQPTRRPVV